MLEQYRLGNSVIVRHSQYESSGRLSRIDAGASTSTSEVLGLGLDHDSLGRSSLRSVNDVVDTFAHDSLGRLLSYTVQAPGGTPRTVSMTYDPLGRLLSKSDVGAYTDPVPEKRTPC